MFKWILILKYNTDENIFLASLYSCSIKQATDGNLTLHDVYMKSYNNNLSYRRDLAISLKTSTELFLSKFSRLDL